MKHFQLAAEPRVNTGKKATKAIRKEQKIPAVLSGSTIVNIPFKGKLKPGEKIVEIGDGKGIITTDLLVTNESVRKLVFTPDIFAVELELNGEKRMAVLKEIQFHPVKDTILHIDFLEVNETKPVVIEVPVRLEGHAAGVKAGGKLSLSIKKLKVKAIYTEIPEHLVINVEDLELGKTIQVGDLHFDGLELVNAKKAVVCAVKLTRAARAAATTATDTTDTDTTSEAN